MATKWSVYVGQYKHARTKRFIPSCRLDVFFEIAIPPAPQIKSGKGGRAQQQETTACAHLRRRSTCYHTHSYREPPCLFLTIPYLCHHVVHPAQVPRQHHEGDSRHANSAVKHAVSGWWVARAPYAAPSPSRCLSAYLPVSRGVRLLTRSPHRRGLSSREGAVNPSLLQL